MYKNTSWVWIWDLNTNKTIWRNKTSSSVVYINIDNVPASPIFHLISWHNYEYCSIHKYTFTIIEFLYGSTVINLLYYLDYSPYSVSKIGQLCFVIPILLFFLNHVPINIFQECLPVLFRSLVWKEMSRVDFKL